MVGTITNQILENDHFRHFTAQIPGIVLACLGASFGILSVATPGDLGWPMSKKFSALALGAAVVGLIATGDMVKAEAQNDAPAKAKRKAAHRAPYRGCCEEGHRFVYAESWYGQNKVIAPVRYAEFGEQVRIPGGTWVYCEYSCEYTLRKQSLDFWNAVTRERQRVAPTYSPKDFYIDRFGNRRDYLF